MCAFLLLCQIKTNIFFSFRFLCVRALKATISLSQRVATERKKKIDTRPLTIGREERGREKKTYRWRTAANPESSDLHLLPSMSCFSRSRTASAVLHSTATSRHVDVMLLITLRETGNDQNWSISLCDWGLGQLQGENPRGGDGADGLLMTGGHLWLELFQFLFPLCPVVSLSLQVRQWRLGAGQPIIKVLHIGVQGAPGRYRLMHSAGNPEIGI